MAERMIFSLPHNEALASSLSKLLNLPIGEATFRHFPDGESYVRIQSDVKGREVLVVCTLHEPDDKLLPLYFFNKTLKEFGASKVILVAPYLAYMRQDKRFNTGESVTSELFAKLISGMADELITIDPHLHRRSNLGEIYSIPTKVLHAAPLISGWIKENISHALIVGPDDESRQWVSEVANDAAAPYIVLTKERKSDNDVSVHLPEVTAYKGLRAVLVDDIVSTAHTMAETLIKLNEAGFKQPVCIGVHGVFANNALSLLTNAGAEVITTNSIPGNTNQIDISLLLSNALK